MKKWLTVLLALAICLVPMTAFAVDYPVTTDQSLTLWKQLDGSIAEGGYTTSNETPGFLAWEEGTGIHVDIQEYNDVTSLVLAISGASELPDMFMMDPANYNGNVMGMVNDELIIQVTPEMLEENAPDYWAYINQPMYMDLIQQLDGNMYYFSGHVFEPESIYRYWKGFFYRGDILEKAGWEKFPTTIDEFYQCLVDLKDAGITTPLVFQSGSELKNMLQYGDISSPFGLVCTGEYQVDGVWHFGAYEPEYKDVLAFMHKLYDEGLISVDYLNMEGSVSQSMLCTGEAAVFYGNNSRLNTFKSSVEEGGWLYPGAPLCAEGAERAMYHFADPMVTLGDSTFITADSKNPELCLQFLNYLYTEKGNLVRNFGVEGQSYEIVDGIPRYTELITNNPEGHALDGMARSWGLINWPGIHADVMNAQRHPSDTQVVAYELWSDSDHDKYVVTHTVVLDDLLDEYTDLWVDIDLYINECRAKFISGEMDVETEFDAYIDHLKSMGMDRVVELKQLTLDAYNAR